MEEAAERVVGHFFERFADASGASANVLVRFYRTVPFDRLEPDLQDFVSASDPERAEWSAVQSLVLLATRGVEPAWSDRRSSVDHRAIPLLSEETVARMPMITALVRDLGVGPTELIAPDPRRFAAMDQRDHRVFHVADAAGSGAIPSQDEFVRPYGVASVIGFGGVLPDGSLFAVIAFSRTPIGADIAEMFRTLALSVKLTILPFVTGKLFRGDSASSAPLPEAVVARSEAAALRQLLDVRASTIRGLAAELEAALEAEHSRSEQLEEAEALSRAIVDASLDAIVNMSEDGCITEFNAVAERIFGYRRDDVIGRELGEVIVPAAMREAHRRGLAHYLNTGEGPVLGTRVELMALRADGSEFPVELAISRADVEGPARFTGFIRDITERHRAQAEVMRGRDRLDAMVHTLQQSLLPPALPEIPGVTLGAAYLAATAGAEIGGDFYDVFATAPNDWALVLGDVCGKGPEAAAVTALTRYTARAAAMRARRPAAVLRQVNQALCRDQTDRFCTVVYGRLRLDAVKGPTLVLGSGGHPPALLLRPGVGVSEISPPGQLLGVFADWEGREARLNLASGDVVVFYSDGLTEARRGAEDLGVDGLTAIVKAAEGMSSQEMADFMIAEVLAFQTSENLDDLAVLVMRVS